MNNKVLLLDAGTTPPSLVSIPGFYPQVEEFPGFNVFYDSVPQTAARNKVKTVKYTHLYSIFYDLIFGIRLCDLQLERCLAALTLTMQ